MKKFIYWGTLIPLALLAIPLAAIRMNMAVILGVLEVYHVLISRFQYWAYDIPKGTRGFYYDCPWKRTLWASFKRGFDLSA